jgi:hypothetical protein
LSAAATDGVIIDIRSQDARELHGVVPGSLHIPRTVLEWRVAVDSPWRSPYIGGLDQRLILICDHGPRRPALCPVQGLPPRPLTRETRLFGWTIA